MSLIYAFCSDAWRAMLRPMGSAEGTRSYLYVNAGTCASKKGGIDGGRGVESELPFRDYTRRAAKCARVPITLLISL